MRKIKGGIGCMGNYDMCSQLNMDKSSKEFTIDNMNEVDAILLSEIAGLDWNVLKDELNEMGELSFEQIFQIIEEKIGMGNLYLIQDEDSIDSSNIVLAPLRKRREELVQALNQIGIYEIDKYNLLYTLAHSPRYKDLKVSSIYNKQTLGEEEIDGKTVTYQSELKAITIMSEYIDVNGETKKIMIPVFAGTGGNLISWIEDARLKVTKQGIQAQKDAQTYVTEQLEEHPDYDLGICGYSKGGNIAAYVGIKMQLEYPEKLKKIINMDGPGFDENFLQEHPEFAQTYKMLLENGILEFYTPKDSFVGMMLFPEGYDEYVHYMDCNTKFVLDGHIYTNWELDLSDRWMGSDWQPRFKTASGLSETAQILRKIVKSIVELPDDEFLSVLTLLEDIVQNTSLKTLGDFSNTEKLGEVLKEVAIYYHNASWTQKVNLTKLIGTILEPKLMAEFICSLLKEKMNINLDQAEIEELLDVIAQLEEDDAVTILDSLFRLLEGNFIDHIIEGNILEMIGDITKWYTTLEWNELNSFRVLKNNVKDCILEDGKKSIQHLLEKVLQSEANWNGKVSFICISSGTMIGMDLISAGLEIYGSIKDCFQNIANQISESVDKFMKLVGGMDIDVTTKDGILEFLSAACTPGLINYILITVFPAIKALFFRQTMAIECNISGMEDCKNDLIFAYEKAKKINEQLDNFYATLAMFQINENDDERKNFARKNRLIRSKICLKNVERIRDCADRIEKFITKLQQWDSDMVKLLGDF